MDRRTNGRIARGRRSPTAAALGLALVCILLLGIAVANATAGGARTYVEDRPGVLVKVTATPSRVTSLRLGARLHCAGGSHRNFSLGFERVTATPIRDGAFVFHYGHANSVTVLRGRVEGSRIEGKFRHETRLTPANVRCGTAAPTGNWIAFVARTGR